MTRRGDQPSRSSPDSRSALFEWAFAASCTRSYSSIRKAAQFQTKLPLSNRMMSPSRLPW